MNSEKERIMNKVLKCALYYHDLGWNIIPIKGKSRPLVPWKPYQKIEVDKEKIKKWFSNGKNNIALITGSPSKVIALDVDSHDVVKLLSSLEGFNKEDLNTWTVRTRRGFHFYFKYDHRKHGILKNTSLMKIDKETGGYRSICDVKGEGGMITLPPSTYTAEDGKTFTYTWYRKPSKTELKPVPEWLINAVKNHNKSFSSSSLSLNSGNLENGNGIRGLYRGVPEGMRNVSLTRLAGSWFRDGLSLEEVLLAARWWNQNLSSPLPEEEVNRTILSIYQREIQQREKANNLKKELLDIFKNSNNNTGISNNKLNSKSDDKNKLPGKSDRNRSDRNRNGNQSDNQNRNNSSEELEKKVFLILHFLKRSDPDELSRISLQTFRNQLIKLFEEIHSFLSTEERNKK